MAHRSRRGFVAYYRRYTKTWVHALATAGLTAFGMLTFVHRGFALVALGVYVVPPIVLYLRSSDVVAVADSNGEMQADPDGETTTDSAGASPIGATADERAGATDESDGNGEVARENGATTDGNEETIEGQSRLRWTTVESPTDSALFDAVLTDAGAFAVGEGGVVVTDGTDGGNGESETENQWRVALSEGPGADARDLRGTDATGDGSAVWVAGDNGALGRLDAETGRHVDHSAPSAITDSWTDVAVTGQSGDETLLLVNGSGELLRGRYRDGEVAWADPTKPGSGSSFCAANLLEDGVGYLADTNDGVYETADGGETVRRVGIEDADGTLTDVAASALGDCVATDDAGRCHEYDGSNWTPIRVDDGALWALDRRDDRTVACGDGGVYERAGATADWERFLTPGDGPLRGVAVGADRAVAVGAAGTIIERREMSQAD